MDQSEKDSIITEARSRLSQVSSDISKEISLTQDAIVGGNEELKSLTGDPDAQETRMIKEALIQHSKGRIEELEKLLPSPYFTRCDIRFSDEQEATPFYFGKFSFADDSIYSWTTPIASLRFEDPGAIAYRTPDDGERNGILLRKDQYMIAGSKLVFLASESEEHPRELIYQEYLSNRKTSFSLPEIVAQMEKAQDQVIRAHHAGPFAISGPAGSGKTTLALHRVAFLTQSPETNRIYTSRTILVLVQDNGTKDYFSHLLPELGIHDIRISTFSEWAFERLNLFGITFDTRIGGTEDERDDYEHRKVLALHSEPTGSYRRKSHYSYLENTYRPFFTPSQMALFAKQKQEGILDRYDLTLLLEASHRANKGFWRTEDMATLQNNGRMKRALRTVPVEYALVVVDEFQNYLPEQLSLFRSTLKKGNSSILYVGDMAQQTQFGTIRDWSEIGETIPAQRAVKLQKVYRNTRNILEYIQGLGYQVDIPDGIKEGPDVVEMRADKEAELAYVRRLVSKSDQGGIGILCKDKRYLEDFEKEFTDETGVKCMSMREAQGVEFETVILVGITKKAFSVEESEDTEYAMERKRINKDLLYVALTRAISGLHILGTDKLQDCVSENL